MNATKQYAQYFFYAFSFLMGSCYSLDAMDKDKNVRANSKIKPLYGHPGFRKEIQIKKVLNKKKIKKEALKKEVVARQQQRQKDKREAKKALKPGRRNQG